MSDAGPPTIPVRPSKGTKQESDTLPAPQIPARPARKHSDRSVSPNPARFAQSPLREGFSKGNKSSLSNDYFSGAVIGEQIGRPPSVGMPSVGEEGMEYGALPQSTNVETTATENVKAVDGNLKLHAPTPALSAQSAKERLLTVTRTDSDKAASFGIGKPSDNRDRSTSRNGLRRKPSSTFSTTSDHEDDHGIPEIGQRVPMNPHLGDVQAPSPDPGPETIKKHHQRKHSGRNLPPGSYGLYGHGVVSDDRLEKAYYEKHPELKQKDVSSYRDRPNDFAMSKNDLNRLVRDTINRSSSSISREVVGTPTEDAAFQASDEYAWRMASPRPSSASAKNVKFVSQSAAGTEGNASTSAEETENAIHIDDSKRPEFYSYGGDDNAVLGDDVEYNAPILAADEIEFGPNAVAQHPAIHPHHDRSDSFDADFPASRPVVRPAAVHHPYSQPEFSSTPLEDVTEYEPLFPEEAAKLEQAKREAAESKARHHFPSKDIWEDAPNSVHYTVEVSAPDVDEEGEEGEEGEELTKRKSSSFQDGRPITPAQAFAQYQEELAERESKGKSNNFLPLQDEKSSKLSWVAHQAHLGVGSSAKPKRFPSKDIWEDAPESQLYEATLSDEPEATTQQTEEEENAVQEQPAIPGRPKSKPTEDASKQPPPVSDKPKPSIPPRPVKRGSGDSDLSEAAAAKPKPPVPSRPAGGKIAALQAGFMSDLNKRLQLGPNAIKKEEPPQAPEEEEEKEKAPLVDARKSRARGPQRRAPAKATSPSGDGGAASVATLSLSTSKTQWAISPEDGDLSVQQEWEASTAETEDKKAPVPEVEKKDVETVTAVKESPIKEEEPAAVAATILKPQAEASSAVAPVEEDVKAELAEATAEA